ncbi:helix-turn-helix domain-containing protein [Sporosarcina limicola]|uniref:Transcriptional regulator with XRE-family HTH domain n=1 Tax=Sporosarcina limicola TaxID=34101 RepID=A0A927MJB3_9BACL|nr:helix-turn-helix transcriptional regulator [Sporosarcina limicola]MBE1555653.1 transcriptional regulator with XRE-family HTH domain [Sporosarcina limicola]
MKKKVRNLLDTSEIVKVHPHFQEALYGLSAVYGHIIFSERIQKGYTQPKLAELSGVSIKTISRAEGGVDNLGLDAYEKLFKALDLSMSDVAKLTLKFSSSTDELAITI